jgi:hypothetical protein
MILPRHETAMPKLPAAEDEAKYNGVRGDGPSAVADPSDKVQPGARSMSAVTIPQIEERLRELSPEELGSVYDFVSYLAERRLSASTLSTMLASEPVLRRDWDRPEEDAAWADL